MDNTNLQCIFDRDDAIHFGRGDELRTIVIALHSVASIFTSNGKSCSSIQPTLTDIFSDMREMFNEGCRDYSATKKILTSDFIISTGKKIQHPSVYQRYADVDFNFKNIGHDRCSYRIRFKRNGCAIIATATGEVPCDDVERIMDLYAKMAVELLSISYAFKKPHSNYKGNADDSHKPSLNKPRRLPQLSADYTWD